MLWSTLKVLSSTCVFYWLLTPIILGTTASKVFYCFLPKFFTMPLTLTLKLSGAACPPVTRRGIKRRRQSGGDWVLPPHLSAVWHTATNCKSLTHWDQTPPPPHRPSPPAHRRVCVSVIWTGFQLVAHTVSTAKRGRSQKENNTYDIRFCPVPENIFYSKRLNWKNSFSEFRRLHQNHPLIHIMWKTATSRTDLVKKKKIEPVCPIEV